ncbi:hypothetical protein [Leisingera sp. ANG-M1]|uniref:hypothetical protein n=1 Tax=Leisingera sp. ANG-M1 TaxID=1577895 RepID=UPI000A835E86|nr:hypothetical protein [Leisingera sp. ANG-M1]
MLTWGFGLLLLVMGGAGCDVHDWLMELSSQSVANFHCSPAATIRGDGRFGMGAVMAAASFRFAKWLPEWFAETGARLIIG